MNFFCSCYCKQITLAYIKSSSKVTKLHQFRASYFYKPYFQIYPVWTQRITFKTNDFWVFNIVQMPWQKYLIWSKDPTTLLIFFSSKTQKNKVGKCFLKVHKRVDSFVKELVWSFKLKNVCTSNVYIFICLGCSPAYERYKASEWLGLILRRDRLLLHMSNSWILLNVVTIHLIYFTLLFNW